MSLFLARSLNLLQNCHIDAGWSSLVAREAHNLEVAGSNPAPATISMASESTPSQPEQPPMHELYLKAMRGEASAKERKIVWEAIQDLNSEMNQEIRKFKAEQELREPS